MSYRIKATDKDEAHKALLRDVPFEPVFIMGLHRSGTTFLHNILAHTRQFNVVRAYHVIRYGEIVDNHLRGKTTKAKQELAEEFESRGITDRQVDLVKVSPESPVEYGFAIDPGARGALTPATLPKFMELCAKIQLTGDPRKPLLLKNPWDVTCFLYVRQCFPNCKFIFLHRHPLSVLHSQIQIIRSIRDRSNPYLALISTSYRTLLEQPWRRALVNLLISDRLGAPRRLAGFRTARGISYLLDNLSQLPESQTIAVRYEDICADPDAELQRIMNFLGIGFKVSGFRSLVQERGLNPSPEARQMFARLRPRIAPYLALCSYDMEPYGPKPSTT